ncbi:MAG: hypothetical protein LBM09_02700 [Candidatus Nomurabacteria bacterium]|nr:hypothetical protein [Candidatus Nomurabacteria bacterium]
MSLRGDLSSWQSSYYCHPEFISGSLYRHYPIYSGNPVLITAGLSEQVR